jgi:membrane carboxypeptidase/penicillin-binding protein PbpC
MFASNPLVTALASLALSVHLAYAANATFYPKLNLTDTSGTLVQAHGGAILRSASSDDDNWYWFGEDKTGLTNSGR